MALGGTGHYAAARTALRRLRASTTDPVLLSLAASTEGSLRRQLGWHARAAHDDGLAAALVLPRLSGVSPAGLPRPALIYPDAPGRRNPDGLLDAAGAAGGEIAPGVACGGVCAGAGVAAASAGLGVDALDAAGAAPRRPDDTEAAGYQRVPDSIDAAADALIGLAADALGTGRLALATRLLDRCAALLEDECPSGSTGEGIARGETGGAAVDRSRALVRLHWVRAETALAGGRGEAALAAAEVALASAEHGPSIRHRVKSRLLVAAAAGVTGDTARAVELAALVEEQCREAGLVPLRWACAMLRTGLPAPGAGPAAGHASAAADAEACRALISRRGGRFRDNGR
ncbi:hypothetical protein [Nocardia carnea]|uniref:hypothetical protein n=1 Tax=Nocardia carnea TaxID=37328 RepID=UPI002458C824|nr:hypothetical protein [Nocardia carnea]